MRPAPCVVAPVHRVVGGLHCIADLTLPYGRVIHDFLAS
jgi:acetoacetate decarboxylase